MLGLVGESGSGKTTVGLAVLGHARRGVKLASGEVSIGEASMLALGDVALRHARGRLVTYVPQDPSTALNPALRIVKQLTEVLEFHNFGGSDAARKARVLEVMSEVALPSTPEFLRRYPHQLSGGQQQRVGLAMAFACRPAVIVLDEPTTGLDVSTQAHVLTTIRELCHAHKVAALYVTHDLAVVANLADQVAVMYAGRIVEQGPAAEFFDNPSHPYTRHLIAAAPDMSTDHEMIGLSGRAPAPGKRPVGCSFAKRCELATDAVPSRVPGRARGRARPRGPLHPAVRGPRADAAHVGALVADRGVGDARPDGPRPLRLVHPASGRPQRRPARRPRRVPCARRRIRAPARPRCRVRSAACTASGPARSCSGSERLAPSARDRTTAQRLRIQYVFQNPYSSLQPRRTVGESVARPLMVGGASKTDAARKVGEMLERVALTAGYANRFPDQLSGGERQRVAIARALVSRPEVLVCDEVTSALDVLVQASIVELLGELRRDLGLAMLFVTHNLPLVASIADQVAVLADGKIVESGLTERVLRFPEAEYTKRLIADTPQISELPER